MNLKVNKSFDKNDTQVTDFYDEEDPTINIPQDQIDKALLHHDLQKMKLNIDKAINSNPTTSISFDPNTHGNNLCKDQS